MCHSLQRLWNSIFVIASEANWASLALSLRSHSFWSLAARSWASLISLMPANVVFESTWTLVRFLISFSFSFVERVESWRVFCADSYVNWSNALVTLRTNIRLVLKSGISWKTVRVAALNSRRFKGVDIWTSFEGFLLWDCCFGDVDEGSSLSYGTCEEFSTFVGSYGIRPVPF